MTSSPAPAPLDPQAHAWRETSQRLARQRRPFDEFLGAYRAAYAERNLARLGPGPAWLPGPEAAKTNVARWMRERGDASYEAFHAWTRTSRDAFWMELVRRLRIPFREAPAGARDPRSPPTRPAWLPGARFNIAEACFAADPDTDAIRYGREGTDAIRRVTYGRLRELSLRVAAGLDAQGLGPEDRVLLYMPMTPESVAAYLGVVLSGRSVVGVADASAPDDLAKRVRISDARLVITVDAYARDGKTLPIYAKAKQAEAPRTVVLPSEGEAGPRTPRRPGDLAWDDFLKPPSAGSVRARDAEAESNLLFSSGTTKDPKAIVWTHATPIKCIADAYVHHDVQPGDVLAWPTSFGWMMGPWLTYASLALGATMAIHSGSPLTPEFGRFVARSEATMVGVVPKIVRAWRQARTMEGIDWSRVRRFSSTGETSDPVDMLYLMWLAGNKPVVEYCGGTEIGGGYVTGTLVQPAVPAAFTTPAVGLDFRLLDESGQPTSRGEVALVPPSIGLSNRLLNYDHDAEYYAGFHRADDGTPLRRHGDQLERLGGGFYRHHGRLDDMINLNGVKTSVEELRAAIGLHADVVDTKPIGVDVDGSGQRVLVVYAVPRDRRHVADRALAERLQVEFGKAIKARLNPLLSRVHEVVLVDGLPQAGPGKTRTQKEFAADYARRAARA